MNNGLLKNSTALVSGRARHCRLSALGSWALDVGRWVFVAALLAAGVPAHAQSTGLFVNSSNNVGIGTTSPNQQLSVTNSFAVTNSSGAQYILMGNQDSGGV